MNIRLRYTNLARLPPNFTLASFRTDYFARERPVLLPRGYFGDDDSLPCIWKWFERSSDAASSSTHLDNGTLKRQDGDGGVRLNTNYLAAFGDAVVEIEATSTVEVDDDGGHGARIRKQFTRHAAPLDLFLKWSSHTASMATNSSGAKDVEADTRLYIAQSALDSLPLQLQADVPLPELVKKAGKGDVYGSSLWMGLAPTSTPLHRDPNPNLFVQIAGRKRVRIVQPAVGDAVFATVKRDIGAGDARLRGEEMMVGREGEMLEQVVWQDAEIEPEVEAAPQDSSQMFEAALESGDALFIPKGWWHAVRGEGQGINASVNWWFR